MRVLGVLFDPFMSMDRNWQILTHKAQGRMGVLARLARFKWGLETGVLKMTHESIVTSLLRYGLVISGSCMPPDLMAKMETHVANVAARRVGGMDKSTRIETLHFLANTQSYRNLYVMHCADLLDATLRAHNSTVQIRIRRELKAILESDAMEVEYVRVTEVDGGLRDALTPEYVWRATKWLIRRYKKQPDWTRVPEIPGIYACNAPEVNKSVFQRSRVFHFSGVESWVEVGLQVLRHIRWSPECALPQVLNVSRLLPPEALKNRVVFGWDHNREEDENRPKGSRLRRVVVRAGALCQDGVGMTICILKKEGRPVCRDLRVHGKVCAQDTPVCLQEMALLHSLQILREWICESLDRSIEQVERPEIWAGDGKAVWGLERWFTTGTLELRSVVASEIAVVMKNMVMWLPEGVSVRPFRLPEEKAIEDMPWYIREILVAAEEFRVAMMVDPEQEWMMALPAIPLLRGEIKAMIRNQMETDELTVFKQLAQLDSM